MHLSYFTDEAHADFETALQLGAAWGLHYADVRTVDGMNVIDLTDAQVTRVKDLLSRYDMRVAALATPFLKCSLPGHTLDTHGNLHSARSLTYADHVALLPRGIAVAQALGAPYLRIFSFWRQTDVDFWPALTEAIRVTLDITADSGITPCLENEGACFIGTSIELAEAARRFPDPRLKFIWDPGNSTHRGVVPRAEDFAMFAGRIAQVHLKDSLYDPVTGKASVTVIGSGSTDYQAELRRLYEAGYTSTLTLEPHYCPQNDCTEGMRQSVVAIRQIAAEVSIKLD
jgi:sugar phosphate isomerase/epimerase